MTHRHKKGLQTGSNLFPTLALKTDKSNEADILGQSDKFFKLPEAEKVAIANIRDANPQRGYSYVGSEATSKVNKRDQKGEFQICEDDDVDQELVDAKVSKPPPSLST